MLYHLFFYVPKSHLETVKQAIFAAGAGQFQHYDQCCWQNLAQGQFRPLENSNPFLGKPYQLETVAEYRVETLCSAENIAAVIAALKSSHPYEIPGYGVIRLENF